MYKRKFLLPVLSLSLALSSGVTAFAATPVPAIAEQSSIHSARFTYVMYASTSLSVSSSGANYNIFVNAIDEVYRISGTATLYKGGEKVDSATIDERTNLLNKSGTLSTDGSGNYRLTFEGTVYANSGSEPLSLEITDSY